MKHYEQLNQYLANTTVLNIKIHNLHWNVEGRDFIRVHTMLDGFYDTTNSYIDDIAEAMRKENKTPMARMVDYLAVSSIKEIESVNRDCKEVLEIVLSDLELMRDLALKIRLEALESDDFEISNLLEDHVAYFAKQIWFLKATLA